MHLFTVALLLAQVQVDFQNFRFPDAGYQGVTDVRVSDGNRFAWEPNVNYRDRFAARVGGDGGVWNRTASCLLRFDLGGIDAGVVSQAALTLSITNPSNDAVQVYPLIADWDEAAATWQRATVGTAWQQGGARGPADRGALLLSFTPNTSGTTQYVLPPALVSGWLVTPGSNNGLLLEAPAMSDAFEFNSDRVSATARPRLSFQVGPTAYLLRDGLNGYSGTTLTCIGNGDDPKLVSQNGTGLEVNGWPTGAPDSNRNRSSALVRFDLTQIPTWAAVVDGKLTLNGLFNNNFNPINAWAMRQSWTESATWYTRNGLLQWLDAGIGIGDDSLPSVIGVMPASDGGNSTTMQLNAEGLIRLQQWVASPSSNFGLVLQDHRLSGEMLGSDESESAFGPQLTVRYFEGALACSNFACGQDAGFCGFDVQVVAADGGGLPPAGIPAATVVTPSNGTVSLSGTSFVSALTVPLSSGTVRRVYWDGTAQPFTVTLAPESPRWQPVSCGPFTPAGAGGGSGGSGGAGGGSGGAGGAGGAGGSVEPPGPGDYRVGCGCASAPGALAFAAMAMLLAARRRRR